MASQSNAGQEASLLSAPLRFICNDGLCWMCRTPGRIITLGTLRAFLGAFSSVPRFPSCSSTVKQLVILSCYSTVRNYTNMTESPTLQRETSNTGTHVAKRRSERTALTAGSGMAVLLGRSCAFL